MYVGFYDFVSFSLCVFVYVSVCVCVSVGLSCLCMWGVFSHKESECVLRVPSLVEHIPCPVEHRPKGIE